VQYSDILRFLDEASQFDVPDTHPHVIELQRLAQLGRKWKEDVDKLLASKPISISDISALIEGHEYTPTSVETMRQLENIRKTATGWETSASGLLASRGSAATAQRLVKTVNTANGPLRRVHVPEVEKLAQELEHIDDWLRSIAKTLNVSEKNVQHSLKTLVSEIEEHLAVDDDIPNDEHACFCRSAPTTNMVTCPVCAGTYHPKCVGISAKSAAGIKAASETFQCQMCVNLQYDDRPSFHKLALHVDPYRYKFTLHPPEWDIIKDALEHTLRYAGQVVKLITSPNTMSQKDAPEIAHLLRKIWTLPIQLDAWNHDTNDEVVFEHWLYHRLRELTDVAGGMPKPAVGNGRTRARKPRFDFEGTAAHKFRCICTTAPPDHLLTVQCGKCEQSFHLSCVKAPLTQANNASRGGWKCPFCIVKQGKPAPRGLDLRVQMRGKSSRLALS
jgi:histone demethylase JARID1